jgi:peptidoglycan/xylan/chitin deacetylase (PgdA/CDA1 family)
MLGTRPLQARPDATMGFGLDRKVAPLGNAMPAGLVRAWVGAALGDLRLAVVFHRVKPPRKEEWAQGMSAPEADVDGVVELLLASRPAAREPWLTVTFDDGYAEAVGWVASRAPRFPAAEFVCFVCPEKAERGAGYRWDLAEMATRDGLDRQGAAEIESAPLDVERENDREDLRRVGRHPEFRVASVEELGALSSLPNVTLGCHSNCHVPLSTLTREQAGLELRRSKETFERLFGPMRHFAFPFGDGFYGAEHVRMLRELGSFHLWGTGQRPHAAAERRPGAVTPRISTDGRCGLRGTAAAIAVRALLRRGGWRGPGARDAGAGGGTTRT